jgi:hypothetical protein
MCKIFHTKWSQHAVEMWPNIGQAMFHRREKNRFLCLICYKMSVQILTVSLIIKMFQFVSLSSQQMLRHQQVCTNHMHKKGHMKHILIAIFKISSTSAKQFWPACSHNILSAQNLHIIHDFSHNKTINMHWTPQVFAVPLCTHNTRMDTEHHRYLLYLHVHTPL